LCIKERKKNIDEKVSFMYTIDVSFSPMQNEQKHAELTHKTFLIMFRLLFVFAIPAIAAYFVGRWIDQTYDWRPYGSLLALAVSFIISWALVIRIYLSLEKEFKQLRESEKN